MATVLIVKQVPMPYLFCKTCLYERSFRSDEEYLPNTCPLCNLKMEFRVDIL